MFLLFNKLEMSLADTNSCSMTESQTSSSVSLLINLSRLKERKTETGTPIGNLSLREGSIVFHSLFIQQIVVLFTKVSSVKFLFQLAEYFRLLSQEEQSRPPSHSCRHCIESLPIERVCLLLIPSPSQRSATGVPR